MAAVKFQKGSEEWQMFMDFWNLCQSHWQTEENDAYWEKLIQDASAFADKYDRCEFANRIAIAFVETQDAEFKKIK